MFVCATDIKHRFFVQNVFGQEVYQEHSATTERAGKTVKICEKPGLNSQRIKLRLRDIGSFSLP